MGMRIEGRWRRVGRFSVDVDEELRVTGDAVPALMLDLELRRRGVIPGDRAALLETARGLFGAITVTAVRSVETLEGVASPEMAADPGR